MKLISILYVSMFCFSCMSSNSETEKLSRRVDLLEQRLDALTHTEAVTTGAVNSAVSDTYRSSSAKSTGRCRALTKKGSQCKRKAKAGGYCWQHAGISDY